MRSGTVEGLNVNGGVSSHRCVTVELLTGETILISTEGKTTCSGIWNRVEGELVARGVVHPQIFGLAIKAGSDWVFVDPESKVSKYFPKEWKSPLNPTSVHDNNKALVLYCRVHFYLEALPQSFDVVSILHYYLQLRQNLISAPRASAANLVQPVALALQAEYGDWRPGSDLPEWTVGTLKLGKMALTREYQALTGMGQPAARLAFIRLLMPAYNMHLFIMTLRTKEGKDAPVWIGVTPKGIEVYQNNVGVLKIPDQPKVTFLWANITKLYFERKKFEIRGRACPWAGSTTQKLSFTASSESVPRHLLILCRCTHQFHLSNNKMFVELNTTTNGNNHQVQQQGKTTTSVSVESGCNSTHSTNGTSNKNGDDKMLDLSLWADGLLLGGQANNEHQRVSVISNASSNTTSGIVSDRVYSLDGSEEDLDLREMPCSCDQSTSLESLSFKPCKSRCHPGSSPSLPAHNGHHRHAIPACCTSGNAAVLPISEDRDAKYWYCDSDCEDCCDDTVCSNNKSGSSLVQSTVAASADNEEEDEDTCSRRMAHCECNSCTTEEDLELDGPDSDSHHHHTPSMASEGTLKAGDLEEVILDDDITHPCEKEGASLLLVTSGGTGNGGTCHRNNKKRIPGGQQRNGVDKKRGEEGGGLPSDSSRRGDDDIQQTPEMLQEHVYGEIEGDEKETRTRRQERSDVDGQHFSTRKGLQGSTITTTSPALQPAVTGGGQKKSDQNQGCQQEGNKKGECKKILPKSSSKEPKEFSSSSSTKVNTRSINGTTTVSACHGQCTDVVVIPSEKEDCCCRCDCFDEKPSSDVVNEDDTKRLNQILAKEMGLKPKIASLKCLRTGRNPTVGKVTSATTGSSTWLPGGSKLVGKKNALNSKKNKHHHHHHHHHHHRNYSGSQLQNDYVEFGETLQQGKYPNGRTVSDNFDTDSDYVQLPPLFPRPLPKKPSTNKLWKFMTKSSNSASSSNKTNGKLKGHHHCSSCSTTSDSGTPSPTPPGPAVNMSTLPRRHKLDYAQNVTEPLSPLSKLSSKSTNALHKLEDMNRPEPPPKPLKRHVSTNIPTKSASSEVEARFITAKPQIVIHTANAEAAPSGIPIQAEILFKSNGVSGPVPAAVYSTKSLGNSRNYAPLSQLTHSQSVDNIYDTVAAEEPPNSGLTQGHRATTASIPCLTPPPYPTAAKPRSSQVVIKTNNYVDVHASVVRSRGTTPPAGKPSAASRIGSVPNNLNNFLLGLQNLKPLSRAPIVQPGTGTMTLQHNNNNNSALASNQVHHSQAAGNLHSTAPPLPPNNSLRTASGFVTSSAVTLQQHNGGGVAHINSSKNMMQYGNGLSMSTTAVNCNGNCPGQQQPNGPNSRFTTVYTNQLSKSQIQQFKAQLYSDMDYVIFPPKDPRVSQQEYFDSKSLSYSTLPGIISTSAYGLNEIPPPYLPPPPPYPAATGATGMSFSAGNVQNIANRQPMPPPRPAKTTGMTSKRNAINESLNTTTSSVTSMPNCGGPTSSPPPSWACNSYGSIYASNASQCSSSQYGGFYSATSVAAPPNASSNLNAENLHKFLSSQSLASSQVSSANIYYPCSTQSAPPLPPYNSKNANKILIENEMRKALESQLASRGHKIGASSNGTFTGNRLKSFRSEESLYDEVHAVKKETEQKLQAMYNLPPPPPYDVTKVSPSDLDLASLRAKCQALELPLLRALCSDGALLTQAKPSKGKKITPTAHAHPKLAPKQLSLPPKSSKPVPAPPPLTSPPIPPQRPPKPSKA